MPQRVGARTQKSSQFRVVSNTSAATFNKELILENSEASDRISFVPGDYLQIDIPAYEVIRFRDFDVTEPFRSVWEQQHVFDLEVSNPEAGRRNSYSLASNLETENILRFNVRIATPPPGQECAPGVGSSYVFSLRPGDIVSGSGPFGDFHIKPTQREMVYIGGGAGMAPLRAISPICSRPNRRRARSASGTGHGHGRRSSTKTTFADSPTHTPTLRSNSHSRRLSQQMNGAVTPGLSMRCFGRSTCVATPMPQQPNTIFAVRPR